MCYIQKRLNFSTYVKYLLKDKDKEETFQFVTLH